MFVQIVLVLIGVELRIFVPDDGVGRQVVCVPGPVLNKNVVFTVRQLGYLLIKLLSITELLPIFPTYNLLYCIFCIKFSVLLLVKIWGHMNFVIKRIFQKKSENLWFLLENSELTSNLKVFYSSEQHPERGLEWRSSLQECRHYKSTKFKWVKLKCF